MSKLYQHGDVLIQKIDKVPGDAKEVKRTARGVVLAEGEATGHYHVTADPGVSSFELNEQLFMNVNSPDGNGCIIKHDEHNPLSVPDGSYEIRKVQEYDHFEEEAREVRD